MAPSGLVSERLGGEGGGGRLLHSEQRQVSPSQLSGGPTAGSWRSGKWSERCLSLREIEDRKRSQRTTAEGRKPHEEVCGRDETVAGTAQTLEGRAMALTTD